MPGRDARSTRDEHADLAPGPAVSEDDPTEAAIRRLGRDVQRALLPRNAPKVEGYEIAAGTNLEADGDGRSVWDAVTLSGGRTALVSLLAREGGFPVPCRLAVARALLRALASEEEEPAELLRRVNDAMADASVEGSGQSVECGILVPAPDGLHWSGSGRPPAAVLRRDGNLEDLPPGGPPLGVMGGFRFSNEVLELGSGDVALVLSEASKGLFRGAADLVATLQGKPAGEVVAAVHRGLRKALDEAPPETTVLYVRKR